MPCCTGYVTTYARDPFDVPERIWESQPSSVMPTMRAMLSAIALALLWTGQTGAQDTAKTSPKDTVRTRALPAMKVTGRIDDLIGVAATASEGRVGAADLRLRPITRE